MKKYNIAIVYNKDETKILFCKRITEPYLGLYNLVGGKIEPGESNINAIYRELEEETAITKKDIKLNHLMDLHYIYSYEFELQVYVGILNKKVNLVPEKHPLYWIDINEDFNDSNKFAGEGNIHHMIELIKIHYSEIFR